MARRPHRPDPFALARAQASVALLAWEAQLVAGMRLMGMAGLWSVVPGENARMVAEKAPAFAEAAQAATRAAMAGRPGHEVTAAWARPLRRATRANARRLSLRGPKRT